MFFAEYLYQTLFGTPPTKEWYIGEYNKIIDDFNALDDDSTNDNIHVEDSYIPNAEFFLYKGIVTDCYSNGGGRIDGKYLFSGDQAQNLDLKKGHRVLCMARKISEDQPVVIYKINSIEADFWFADDENFDKVTTCDLVPLRTYHRMLRGEIKAKLNGEIVVETQPVTSKNIKMKISEIGVTYSLMEGDQVEVEVQFGIDHKNPDIPHELIGYSGVKPTDSMIITGKITTFKKRMKYGLIEEKYLFYMDVLQRSSNQNFMPNVKDEVNVQVISSHQKIDDQEFFHRCVDLTPINFFKKDRSGRMESEPNEFIGSDDEIDDDDCGLIFTKNIELKVLLESEKSRKTIEIVVNNKSNSYRRIHKVQFSNEIIASYIECNALYSPQIIKPGDCFVYKINIADVRIKWAMLHLDFQIDEQHLIRRSIIIEVKCVAEVNAPRVEHSKAYTQKVYSGKVDVVKGRTPIPAPHFIDQRLKHYFLPEKLFEDTMRASHVNELINSYCNIFSTLTPTNYAKFFHHLLWFEECHMRHEFRMYDQDRGHFIRDGEYLAYEMKKNIFECRPSIVIGDQIKAFSLLKGSDQRCFAGIIHRIERHRLRLKFDEEFQNAYRGEDYKLIFEFSRSNLMKKHNAIERIDKRMRDSCRDLMFPITIKPSTNLQLNVKLVDGDIELQFPRQKLAWFNPKLNEIQKKAVVNVLRGEAKKHPYLVFGPPGTGKTSTIFEMILQLYRKGNSRIIVAAPSNSAANLITKLLAECKALKPGEFARIAGQNSIEKGLIPDELKMHCITVDIAAPKTISQPENPFENGIRVQCNSDYISLQRILVSTCSTFGSLLYMKFKENHFTHVIIDEAGQCTEPEIAIPISLLAAKNGQIILAGDPQQLGPIVHSLIGQICGMNKSLLSRLLDFVPYHSDVGQNGGYDKRLVTQLLHNYRSIPSILEAYSKLSYESKLIPQISGDNSDKQKLLAWVQATISPICKLKHSPKYGIYFKGVEGDDTNTSESTSWRNFSEINEVGNILYSFFQCGLDEKQIGIITPYTLQVKEIREMCDRCFNGKQPKVGSVEEFQGQERDVIIISTVRSKGKYISQDGKYGLGFVKNKNRLNVAISRARAILIIIGNPYVLALDENWRQLIYDCHINGSYSGCKIPQAVLENDQY